MLVYFVNNVSKICFNGKRLGTKGRALFALNNANAFIHERHEM